MRQHFVFVLFMVVLGCGVAGAGLVGVSDIQVDNDELLSLTYDGATYVVADGDLVTGTTTRWYIDPASSEETLWPDGTSYPLGSPTVSGTSTPKDGDIGANADDFIFRLGGNNHISSIDGIDFQETVFDEPTDIFFMFERGGNDQGTIQLIMPDGSLGAPMTFAKGTAGGGPYADTGVSVSGQNAWGLAITSDMPAIGFRVTASGHDALSISTVPEPTTLLLLGVGAVLLRKRR